MKFKLLALVFIFFFTEFQVLTKNNLKGEVLYIYVNGLYVISVLAQLKNYLVKEILLKT